MRELIEAERDIWKRGGCSGWVLQEFILRHGRECVAQPLPRRFRKRIPKACYWNAQALVKQVGGRLAYCEGYVTLPKCPILILHAWALDDHDRVIDPTIGEPGRSEYFGVPFGWKDFLRLRPRAGGGPFLDGPCGFQTGLWLEFDPSFKEVLAEAGFAFKNRSKKLDAA
jgi:hypothetical protein